MKIKKLMDFLATLDSEMSVGEMGGGWERGIAAGVFEFHFAWGPTHQAVLIGQLFDLDRLKGDGYKPTLVDGQLVKDESYQHEDWGRPPAQRPERQ